MKQKNKTLKSGALGIFFGIFVPIFLYYLIVLIRNFIIPHVIEGKGGHTDPVTGERIWDRTAWWCENWWGRYRGWDCTFTEWIANKADFIYFILPILVLLSIILFVYFLAKKNKKKK